MRALLAAAVLHGIHGVIALGLGVAGIVNGLLESHIPEGDWQLFALLVTVAPAFAAWTAMAARRASTDGWRPWVLPRAAVGLALLVVYAVVGLGAIGLAGSGGLGAAFMVALAMGMGWAAVPELLFIGGAVRLVTDARAAARQHHARSA